MSEKRVVRTEAAPAPFQGAPYSQAIAAGELVFVSGQLGLAPGETTLEQKSIEEQTRQVLENVKLILEQAGSGLERLLKTTVFLADLADFAAMNSVYTEYVGTAPPARATVQVAGLPSGALVEIDAVALAG
jgi:2-iminobutanoate/2-iminopropanoate deaminase